MGQAEIFRRCAMHEEYMRQALALAQEAAAHGEVPVGCVIVREGRIVGRGRNRREEKQHTSSHAEMEAIRQANEALGTWRLDDCTLYVTLEPCPMCAGAILNARIPRVYYGARDREMGACGGVLNLFMEDFPHPPALVGREMWRYPTGYWEKSLLISKYILRGIPRDIP